MFTSKAKAVSAINALAAAVIGSPSTDIRCAAKMLSKNMDSLTDGKMLWSGLRSVSLATCAESAAANITSFVAELNDSMLEKSDLDAMLDDCTNALMNRND